MAAAAFAGAKPGYAFRSGASGMGYYDEAASAASAADTPEYTVTHHSEKNHTRGDAWSEDAGARPDNLIVRVQLPAVGSAGDVSVDVELDRFSLSAGKYALDFDLPYRVNEADGTARFDAAKRVMEVTLPVTAGQPKRRHTGTANRLEHVASKMIKQSEMDSSTMYRDYNFLACAVRQVDAGGRQREKWETHPMGREGGGRGRGGRGKGSGRARGDRGRGRGVSARGPIVELIPKKVSILKDQAYQRGTQLVVLSAGMRKRKLVSGVTCDSL